MNWKEYRVDCPGCLPLVVRSIDDVPLPDDSPEMQVVRNVFQRAPEAEKVANHEVFCNASCNQTHTELFDALGERMYNALVNAGWMSPAISPKPAAWKCRPHGPSRVDLTDYYVACDKRETPILVVLSSKYLFVPCYANRRDLFRHLGSIQIDYHDARRIGDGERFQRGYASIAADDPRIKVVVNLRRNEDGDVEWTWIQ